MTEPPKDDEPPLRARIAACLRRSGLSHTKFAIVAGVSAQTVFRYMRGETWSLDTERKFEAALKVIPKRRDTRHRPITLEEIYPLITRQKTNA